MVQAPLRGISRALSEVQLFQQKGTRSKAPKERRRRNEDTAAVSNEERPEQYESLNRNKASSPPRQHRKDHDDEPHEGERASWMDEVDRLEGIETKRRGRKPFERALSVGNLMEDESSRSTASSAGKGSRRKSKQRTRKRSGTIDMDDNSRRGGVGGSWSQRTRKSSTIGSAMKGMVKAVSSFGSKVKRTQNDDDSLSIRTPYGTPQVERDVESNIEELEPDLDAYSVHSDKNSVVASSVVAKAAERQLNRENIRRRKRSTATPIESSLVDEIKGTRKTSNLEPTGRRPRSASLAEPKKKGSVPPSPPTNLKDGVSVGSDSIEYSPKDTQDCLQSPGAKMTDASESTLGMKRSPKPKKPMTRSKSNVERLGQQPPKSKNSATRRSTAEDEKSLDSRGKPREPEGSVASNASKKKSRLRKSLSSVSNSDVFGEPRPRYRRSRDMKEQEDQADNETARARAPRRNTRKTKRSVSRDKDKGETGDMSKRRTTAPPTVGDIKKQPPKKNQPPLKREGSNSRPKLPKEKSEPSVIATDFLDSAEGDNKSYDSGSGSERNALQNFVDLINSSVYKMARDSPFLCTEKRNYYDVAQFMRDEIKIGETLGEGSYSVAHEVADIVSIKDNEGRFAFHKIGSNELLEQVTEEEEEQRRTDMAEKALTNGRTRYAIKHVKSELLDDPDEFEAAVVDLIMEAKYLARIDHPHILKIRGLVAGGVKGLAEGRHDGFFLITDKLEETLEERIQRWKAGELTDGNTIEGKLRITLQIGSAINYLHERKLIYRDLKPENVGFKDGNNVELFDFGLCRDLPENPSKSSSCSEDVFRMSCAGSLRYMAPEVKLKGRYNLKADVYSWAILCYEFLSLIKPFCGKSREDMKHDVFENRERPNLEEGGLPPSVQKMLSGSWVHEIEKRHTMKEALYSLQSVLLEIHAANFKNLVG